MLNLERCDDNAPFQSKIIKNQLMVNSTFNLLTSRLVLLFIISMTFYRN